MVSIPCSVAELVDFLPIPPKNETALLYELGFNSFVKP